MSQGTVIVGGVIVAFIVWITLQRHLSAYLNDLGIGKPPIPPTAGQSGLGSVLPGAGGLLNGPSSVLPPLGPLGSSGGIMN
jgi:hypothetical protein